MMYLTMQEYCLFQVSFFLQHSCLMVYFPTVVWLDVWNPLCADQILHFKQGKVISLLRIIMSAQYEGCGLDSHLSAGISRVESL